MCVQDACSVGNNPPGRRVVSSDLRRIIVLPLAVVAVYWRLPEATGDDPKGKRYELEAAVNSVNSRKGTMKIAYLEDGSEDV